MNSKLRSILTSKLEPLLEEHSISAIQTMIQSLKDVWINNKKDSNGWKKPEDYHVTVYYVGKDEEKTSHELY